MDSSKTKSAFENGWFVTGDIGKLDSDGFLFIEGRLSRFSKIGGEMIPHETIEAEAIKILDLQHDDQIKLVIVGIPHYRKG